MVLDGGLGSGSLREDKGVGCRGLGFRVFSGSGFRGFGLWGF